MNVRKLFLAPERENTSLPPWVRAFNSLLALVLLAFVFYLSFARLEYHWGWESVWNYRRLFLQGWWTTIWISVAALGLSTLIGLLLALARRTRILALRYFSIIYVELVRGTPLLVQILILFYVVAAAMRIENRYLVGILVLSFFEGAYISEIFRAGIEAVSKTQIESARAVGFTRFQTYRYVIFPQALRQTLPPMAGQLVSLIKDSSLLSIISINELTLNAQQANAFTYSTLESYLPLAAGYLILTLPISLWTRWLEKRMKYET